jgi:hypothetical protein
MTELQSNQQLIADFGQLYNAPRTKEQASSSAFLTSSPTTASASRRTPR